MLRPPQRVLRRAIRRRRPVFLLLLAILILDAIALANRRPRARRVPIGASKQANTTVFIASVHRNTGRILPDWSVATLALVQYLGADNVYFSAVESGSQDDTKEKLAALKEQLDARGVPNTISLGMTVWEQLDEMWTRPDPAASRVPGWIWNEEDKLYDLRRISYLAKERNRAMEPMRVLEGQGITFHKLLWINDIMFNVEDFVTLLHTNDGNYASACSMDFKYPSTYYDTFALRDEDGHKTSSSYWPWFRSPASRDAVLHSDPVPVQSCWNGMVLFDAKPFYGDKALRFRAISDSLADYHLEASECCLIHADNPLTTVPDQGVWLNPNVRVGYSLATYESVQAKHGSAFPNVPTAVLSAWVNRWVQWKGILQQHFESTTVLKRVSQWSQAEPYGQRSEPGLACLVNEKQIMWMNGWKHL
ncbi:cryptococcal mannosyltransferase 1-domain-containing protein [Coniella lustricola]|uniref:Cryptococcal mannosyltransferase 1-domain-containing protein n=1 Tax=Coniella lustricola TaxID=2025994 RepID=A0A2T2ZY87_9PEZI|nr:cryptococcal mannosyltransferase 1-domain-containing protein [Coniella lustricola]